MDDRAYAGVRPLARKNLSKLFAAHDADAVRAAVLDGADLGPHLDAVTAIWNEGRPGMEPLSTAVAVHCLRAGDLGRVRSILACESFAQLLLPGIEEADAHGVDIRPILPDVYARLRRGDPRAALRVLRRWVERDPNRGAELPRPVLLDVARDVISTGGDMSGLVRPIGECLPRREVDTRLAARILVGAVQRGTDLGPAEEALREALSRPRGGETRQSAAHALTLHLLEDDGAAVVPLTRHRSAVVRRGAMEGLAHALVHGHRSPALLSLLWRGLRDRDGQVRATTHRTLGELRDRRLSLRPTDETVNDVVARGLPSAEEWLAELARRHRDLAARLGPPSPPACAICRKIPELTHAFTESELPAARKRLRWRDDIGRCPTCGNFYRTWTVAEVEVYTLEVDYYLERLTPPVVLRDHPTRAYERDLPAMLERYERELDHDEAWARADAARSLTEWHLSQQSLDEVEALLRHPRPVVQREAVCSLARLGAPKILLPAVERLREHPDDRARQAACGLLSRGDARPR